MWGKSLCVKKSILEKVYDLMQAYLTQEIIIIIRKKSEWSKGQNYTFVTGMSNNLDRAPNLGGYPFLRWWGVGVFSIMESWGAVAASQQTFFIVSGSHSSQY